MTSVSIQDRWPNSASQAFNWRQGIQFTDVSSAAQNFSVGPLNKGSVLSALREIADPSVLVLLKGLIGFGNTAVTTSSTILGASAQSVLALGHRSVDRRIEIEFLAEKILSFLDSPYLDGRDARNEIVQAMKDALSFIQIIPNRIDLPIASHTEDGEIVLLWSLGSRRAEAVFSGGGEFGYAVREQNGFVPGKEIGDPSVFPSDLLAYLG